MKSIDEILIEAANQFNFEKALVSKSKFNINLNEADDDDFSGDDLGGDLGDDDFGEDDSGDDLGGDTEVDSVDETEGDETNENGDDHEDDPDFTVGIKNADSAVLDNVPSGETVYDSDGVFKSIRGVIESLQDAQLAEIDGVKRCLELIFSGKKLKPNDLDFDNIQNAIFLINKIMEPLDERTRNYAKIKLKAPLQIARDEEKLDIASKQKALNKTRETILNIDKIK